MEELPQVTTDQDAQVSISGGETALEMVSAPHMTFKSLNMIAIWTINLYME